MSITSANSVFTLVLPGLYPVPQVLEGFAADDAFANDGIAVSESVMGVDGRMSSGYVPSITLMNIALQADSPSISIFEFWLGAMKVSREILRAEGTILMPGTGRSYVLTNGVLQTVKQLPDSKKLLTPQTYAIAWERVDPAVV